MALNDADIYPPGKSFGRYEIVRLIGSGGMGAVYEATHLDLKKRVALKVLLPEFAKSADSQARFLREGEAVSRIRHPHVVDVSDVGIHAEVPFLVMEYLEGEDLASTLRRDHVLSVGRIADVMLPVLAAVATAHEERVIHRDLKPENIFLSRTRHGDIHPKVLDFGISKLADVRGMELTNSQALLGTPFYMSPEQAQGAKNTDERSDQYALGVILYECVTGVLPFEAPTIYKLIVDIVQGRFEKPRARRSDVPEAFERIVLRAMNKEPAARFPSLHAMGRALLPFASEKVRVVWREAFSTDAFGRPSPFAATLGGGGSVPRSSGPGAARGARANTLDTASRELDARGTHTRRRPAVWAFGVAVLVGAGGGWYLLSRHGGASRATTAAAAQAPATARVAGTYRVVVAATPPEAAIEIDGAAAGVGTVARDVPRDGVEHRMRVTADGYEPRTFAFRDGPPPSAIVLARVAPSAPLVVAETRPEPPAPPGASAVVPALPRTPVRTSSAVRTPPRGSGVAASVATATSPASPPSSAELAPVNVVGVVPRPLVPPAARSSDTVPINGAPILH